MVDTTIADMESLKVVSSVVQTVGTPIIMLYFLWRIIDRVSINRQMKKLTNGGGEESGKSGSIISTDISKSLKNIEAVLVTYNSVHNELKAGQEKVMANSKEVASVIGEEVCDKLERTTDKITSCQQRTNETLMKLNGAIDALIQVLRDHRT